MNCCECPEFKRSPIRTYIYWIFHPFEFGTGDWGMCDGMFIDCTFHHPFYCKRRMQ